MTAATAAVVKDGLVDTVIVVDIDADRNTLFTIPGVDIVVLPDGSPTGIGWTYDGKAFSAPAAPTAPVSEAAAETTPQTAAPETAARKAKK